MAISLTNPSENNAELREALLSSSRALFVGAHPDDIEYRAGGLVYLMRQRGVEVTFAIATRGGKRLPEPFKRAIEQIRTRHQLQAAEIMGGAEVTFYDYPDGTLSHYREQFTEDLKTLISTIQPDIILSWDPNFISIPHPDHQAAAEATLEATKGIKTIFYGTLQPNLWIGFDEEAFATKICALKAHRTETPWCYFDLWQKRRLVANLSAEGEKIDCDYAETFRML